MNKCKSCPLHVIGAGGHAKVVISTLLAAGFTVAGVFDDDKNKWGQSVLGFPIRGGVEEGLWAADVPMVLAIGSNAARKELAERYVGRRWATVVHPASYIDPTTQLGPGTVVFAGAVIQPDTIVGSHVIVNTSASVDHDCRVSDYVHLAPGTHLAGNVRLETGAFMGIGSCALPGVAVGRWATVGAGGVVVRDLPDRVTAIGVPARITVDSGS